MGNTDTVGIDEGLFKRLLGDKAALADALEKHLRENPADSASALLFVASQLAQNGQYVDAIPLYIEALRLKPAEPSIYFYLGLAYHGLSLRPERQRVWDELANRFPGHALDDYQAALRLMDANQTQEAMPLLEQALSKSEAASVMHAQILSTLNALKHK